MSGIGIRRITVSARVLQMLLMQQDTEVIMRSNYTEAREVASEVRTYFEQIQTMPPDARIVDVCVIERNMKGKPPSEAGKFAYHLIFTHPSFDSERDGILPAAKEPSIPLEWDYARTADRSDAANAAERERYIDV